MSRTSDGVRVRDMAKLMPELAGQLEHCDSQLLATAGRDRTVLAALNVLVKRRVRAVKVAERRVPRALAMELTSSDKWLFQEAGFWVFGLPEIADSPWRTSFLPRDIAREPLEGRTVDLIQSQLEISHAAVRWWFKCCNEWMDFDEALIWFESPEFADERTNAWLSELASTTGD